MTETKEIFPVADLELEKANEKAATEMMAAPKNEYRDPRKPAVPFAIEQDVDHVLYLGDGTYRETYNLVYDEWDTQRIRQGQCCFRCGESQMGHEGAFPEKCWLCGYKMRENQSHDFSEQFQGSVRVGPTTSVDEELEIAEEIYEADERRRRGVTPSGIWVPKGI